jgi:hypothetical protein
MSKLAIVGGALAAVAVAGLVPAFAHQTGFDSIHEQRREGNRVCMIDHWHYGSGSAQPNRKAAERSAIESWSSFTAFEYGTTWANFSLAASKKFNCEESGTGVRCDVEARPCRKR